MHFGGNKCDTTQFRVHVVLIYKWSWSSLDGREAVCVCLYIDRFKKREKEMQYNSYLRVGDERKHRAGSVEHSVAIFHRSLQTWQVHQIRLHQLQPLLCSFHLPQMACLPLRLCTIHSSPPTPHHSFTHQLNKSPYTYQHTYIICDWWLFISKS